jgi:5-enolpyruvylshikimate-3-phosphate synthase
MNMRFEPRGALRRAARAGGQVDLPPRRAARRDGLRAGADRALPARRRHQPRRSRPCARSARSWRCAARRSSCAAPACARRASRRADRRRQRRHAAAPAAGLAGRAGGALVHARRRRVDPPPAGRPDRRAAAADGARSCEARDGRFPPLTGARRAPAAISYELPVASAQVKSCVLLAALAADGATTVGEPARSRDHTERMLLRAGRRIHRNGRHVTVVNADELVLERRRVPGDPSSAAFLVAAGVLVPGSRLLIGTSASTGRAPASCASCAACGHRARRPRGRVRRARRRGAGQRPRRRPRRAGGHGRRGRGGAAGDRRAAAGRAARLLRRGRDVVRGAQELRVKESDRIAGVVEGLRGLGAEIEATDDGFAVRGSGGLRGGTIDAHGDHRLAMMGAVAGPRLARGGRGDRDGGRRRVSYPGSSRTWRAVLVAIDGPAGAGKSTVARALARELGFTYLDSGAMYRCVALLSLAVQALPAPRSPRWPARHDRAGRRRGRALRRGDGVRRLRGCCSTAATSARRSARPRSPRRPRVWPPTRRARGARRQAARADRERRLGRRGARHRHRRRARRRAEGLPDRRPRERARRRAAELGADVATVLAEQTMRDERDARASTARCGRARRGRARHHRAERRRGRGADRRARPRLGLAASPPARAPPLMGR